MTRPADHLASLDVLRGIAILVVFVYHAQLVQVPGFEIQRSDYGAFWLNEGLGKVRVLWNLVPSAFGFSGVELFLLISGFLIHHAYLSKGKRLDAKAFMWRRFWRIYPPYLLALIIFSTTVGHKGAMDLISHGLLLHNLQNSTFFSINPSFWSLALEFQLYLLYPVLLLSRARWGMSRTMLALSIISVSLRIALVIHPEMRAPALGASVLTYWLFWAAGAWIAERHLAGRPIFRKHVALMIGLAIAITILRLTVIYFPARLYVLALFHAALIEYMLIPSSHTDQLATWPVRALAFIGISSYTMYLYHQPLLGWMHAWLAPYHLPLRGVTETLISLLITIPLAYMGYKALELPSVRFGSWLRNVTWRAEERSN